MVIVLDEDPTDFEGVVPIPLPAADDHDTRKTTSSATNAATGASAAGMRAISVRLVAFYFRAPAKSFLRTRIDYMQLARAINPQVQANERWSWRMSTPGLLAHAVRTHGWAFVPNQLLPPLIANVAIGAVLYTSYLQFLGSFHPPSSVPTRRVYPPPPLHATFLAGFAAGTVQCVIAAPLDAIQARFCVNDVKHVIGGKYKSMWQYGWLKLREVGSRGVFAGWGISFLKESLGCGIFFASFEYVKQQLYDSTLARFYGASVQPHGTWSTLKPHYALEPMFILLAGVTASVTQQLVQHPFTILQTLHLNHLQAVDNRTRSSARRAFLPDPHSYRQTFTIAQRRALEAGGWRSWLFKGFVRNTVRQIPSTSAGLIVFELLRRRYGSLEDEKWIENDGR
ncbi:MAG: hypothetical protein M1816_006553 [Peltula sp. TS41687]|nr:MAG: hypothetical protein M1816_006553 [Peltula sp. TS41687]